LRIGLFLRYRQEAAPCPSKKRRDEDGAPAIAKLSSLQSRSAVSIFRLLAIFVVVFAVPLWPQESAPPPPPATNARFPFSYKVPYGWVDRTASMQAGDTSKGQVLLAAFERPPEVTSDSVNSAVIIAAESAASYPGLKTAVDYFGPLSELTTSKGFTVLNPPYMFTMGSRHLPRADYSKPMGKLSMHQSSLAMLSQGYVLSFTFIAGSADEVDHLMESLKLSPVKSVH
jgi:hypothetical protein